MPTAIKPSRTSKEFDLEYDLVVVGYGYAGGISAIVAADNGAKVLVIEKSAVPGGISICSYGALRCANDRELAFQYLKETNAGRTPDDVIRALADGMCEMEGYVRELGKISGAVVTTTEEWGKGANYPLKGYKAFYHTNIELPNFNAREAYPWANGAPGGPVTFKVVEDNLKMRSVDVMLETEALRLISRDVGETQEVLGVTIRTKDAIKRVKARYGVILCTGGFEGNREYREQFWEGMPVNPCCGQNNTGDGIRMAQELGAKLWHMWHFHGGYGFTHPDPDYPYMIRVKRLPDWTPTERTRRRSRWRGSCSIKTAGGICTNTSPIRRTRRTDHCTTSILRRRITLATHRSLSAMKTGARCMGLAGRLPTTKVSGSTGATTTCERSSSVS